LREHKVKRRGPSNCARLLVVPKTYVFQTSIVAALPTTLTPQLLFALASVLSLWPSLAIAWFLDSDTTVFLAAL
jgi:hypothetical protein